MLLSLPACRRLAALAVLAACSAAPAQTAPPANPLNNPAPANAPAPKAQQPDLPPTAAEAVFDGQTMTLAGVSFTIPESWQKQELPANQPIRPAARFQLAAPDGVNAEPATVSFFHGIRGTPEANVARWRGQMTDVTAGPEEKDTTIAGQRVLTLFAQGTYSAGMAMATSTPKENWVVLGAVISGPQGDIHVLARGHKDILLPQREAWDTVLAGLSVAGAPAGAAPSAPTGPVSATVDGDTLTAAGVRFTVPSAWTRQEVPEATRVKPLIRYQLSPPAGSSIDPGSVNFFHGLGGTPERILSLWLVQVNSVQGRPEKLDRQINGMRVVSLLAQGVYTPGAGMTEGTPKENWVIMGAVVGGPQGDLQIIARGPKETLLPQREAWEAMLNSATPTQPMPEKAAEPATPMSQPVRP